MKAGAGFLGAALLALASAGCVAPGADIHLEPFFARFSTPDGAVETEALFGLYHRRVGGLRKLHGDDEPGLSRTTFGPLWSWDVEPEAGVDWRARFLVPLGFANGRGEENQVFLFPLFSWQKTLDADGSEEQQLITLIGMIYRHNEDRGGELAWFPVYGDLNDFTVFDRVQWALWPLWTRVEGDGSVGRHVLFPVFKWTDGEGQRGRRGWRVWPLAGHSWHAGNYDRWFVLWPIFHRHQNDLAKETPETKWAMLPLIGHTSAGTYRATTLLWPFLGFAADSDGGFWALDFPWPLIRLQRGPGDFSRTRFWPLVSYLHTGTLDYWSFAWPFVHVRRERYRGVERDSVYVIPVWQSWERRDLDTGERSSWRKGFPLFQYETHGDWRRGSFPTLDPFQRNELFERHFAWLWKVWEWEAEGMRRHERSWGGVVRRERDERESRTSVSGLWSRRTRTTPSGSVREHSLLFGLLRWRVTEADGFDMLGPAFPGPGWSSEWGSGTP